MSQVYHESEHQELFYVDADLRGETAVHIPSALGKLGYYVCVLVPEAMTDALSGVKTKLKVGGLRPDDVGSAYGELIDREPVIRSKQDGMAWVLLCRVAVSRGDGVLSFDGMPDGLDRATVLLCTWPRFLESGQADDWLACQADPRWAPNGVPLGGIGAGKVEVSRDGRFRNFSGNNNQDMPFEEPDGLEGAYLAVTCDGERRLLATRPMAGIQPCDDLRPSLMFPQVNLRSVDVFPDITVEVTLYSAFLPHDVEQSSLPGFIARWSVTNDRPAPAVVSCQLGWPNLVGSGGGVGKPETKLGFADGHYRFWTAPDEPTAEVVDLEEGRGIRYGNAPSDVSPAADGHHYVIGGPNTEVDADPRRGSIAQHVTVEPYQRKSGHMVVLWAMPKYIDQQQVNRGLAWPGHFADGGEAAMWLLERAEEIFTDSSLLPLHLLEPLMPGDLTARLANCNYPLITNSVLYADHRDLPADHQQRALRRRTVQHQRRPDRDDGLLRDDRSATRRSPGDADFPARAEPA